MKYTILIFLFLSTAPAYTQGSPERLDVVSWNVEWFGASFQSPADDDLQEHHTKLALRLMNADIYGLVEVVDTMRLRRLTDSLGADFDFVISPFGSNNSTGTGTSWLNAQKLAFIYNSQVFSNVTARGMMRNSGPAYTNWSSGRFPFLLSADVALNQVTKRINFILIHAKAGSSESDYLRRQEGARELKDTLDAFHSDEINIIMGDFNDALHTTICNSCQSQASSFDVIVRDSMDNDHYRSITLPLGVSGQSSMTSFPNVVDNHVISDELFPFYVPGSASIRTDIASQIPNYANTTSDHYPVYSQYILSGISTGMPYVDPALMGIRISSNPFRDQIGIQFNKPLKNISVALLDVNGRRIKALEIKHATGMVNIPATNLAAGVYYLRIITQEKQTVLKLLHL